MVIATSSRFQLLRKLGEGGMGIVYEAYDRLRKKRIALKKLRNHNADSILRFKREFRALGNISHPNIITLYELVEEDGDWYLTMEVIDGRDFVVALRGHTPTLYGRLVSSVSTSPLHISTTDADCDLDTTTGPTIPLVASGRVHARGLPRPPIERPSLTQVAEIPRLWSALRQLAHALHALHSIGTVHRDLKPSNVLVTRSERVVLMDFGIVAESGPGGHPNEAGMAVGTPGFMAPEQAQGASPTAATDWYAFGVMMYAVLTGTPTVHRW